MDFCLEGNRFTTVKLCRSGRSPRSTLRELTGRSPVIDFGGEIQSPQRHAEQEPHPGHDAVAVADAHPHPGQVQLELPKILACSRLRRSLQKRRRPLAAVDMAPLRMRAPLARVHVVDHAPAQRADSFRTYGQLLSWMRLKTPRSSRQEAPPAIDDLCPGYRVCGQVVRLSRLSRSDLVPWRCSVAGRMSAWIDTSRRRPKTCTKAETATRMPPQKQHIG
jgi:hypothetical protein